MHVGYRNGGTFSAANDTRDTLRDILNRYAFFSGSPPFSMGTGTGDLPFQLRADETNPVIFETAFLGRRCRRRGAAGSRPD